MFGRGHVTYYLLLEAYRKVEKAENKDLLETDSTHVNVQTAQDLAIRQIIARSKCCAGRLDQECAIAISGLLSGEVTARELTICRESRNKDRFSMP